MKIADAAEEGSAWLLSLDNVWFRCKYRAAGLWLYDAAGGIVGGMSGSPINDDGRSIGVLITSASAQGDDGPAIEGGPNPRLMARLPGFLLNELTARRRVR